MSETTRRTIFKVVYLLGCALVGIYAGNQYGWPWAIAGFFGAWIAGVLLIVAGAFAYVGLAYQSFCPRRWSRPIYLHWKAQVQANHKKNPIHPLVDFPLAMFIELQLDREFEAGGIRGAQQALQKWLAEFPDRMTSAVQEIAKHTKPSESVK